MDELAKQGLAVGGYGRVLRDAELALQSAAHHLPPMTRQRRCFVFQAGS